MLAGSGTAACGLANALAWHAATWTWTPQAPSVVPGADELRLVGWIACGCGLDITLVSCFLHVRSPGRGPGSQDTPVTRRAEGAGRSPEVLHVASRYRSLLATATVLAVLTLLLAPWAPDRGGSRPPGVPEDPPPAAAPSLRGEAGAKVSEDPSASDTAAAPSEETAKESRSSLTVTVTSPDGDPALDTRVTVAAQTGDDGIWRSDQQTDGQGTARLDPPPGFVIVTARHPRMGVASSWAWAPGRTSLSLRGGPSVHADTRGIPTDLRRVLRIVCISHGREGDVVVERSLDPDLVDLGTWPPGDLSIWLAAPGSLARRQQFLLPDAERAVCRLTWAPDCGLRLRLDSMAGPWMLSHVDPSADTRVATSEAGVVRQEAGPDGVLVLPAGCPGTLCRADAAGRASTFFYCTSLPLAPDAARVIPMDRGCVLELDLGSAPHPPLHVVLLGYEDSPTGIPIGGDQGLEGDVSATARGYSPLLVLHRIPSDQSGVRRLVVPSRATLGVFGDDERRRVSQTVSAGQPGGHPSLTVHPLPAATIVVAGPGLAASRVVLSEAAHGLQQLSGPVSARASTSGSLRITGIPVPFEGTLTVSRGARRWSAPVAIEAPGRRVLGLEDLQPEGTETYSVRVLTDEGLPARTATVMWGLNPGGVVFTRTDDDGVATLSGAKGAVTLASVSLDGYLPVPLLPVRSPGRQEVRLEPAAKLRVVLGASHVGEARTIRIEGPHHAVRTKSMTVLGPSACEFDALKPGAWVARVLDGSDQELDSAHVQLEAGDPRSIEFP